jgi:dTMP kinase
MIRGRYIVLEGPEGVGKTTQITELASRLQKAGLPVRVLREPDSQSDLTARTIRQMTQDPRYPMNTRTEVLLYNAARSQSLQVIRESVDQGVICIVDRNYLTTLAIQYYGRGDVPDYNAINSIISFAVGGVEPDLCVVLDAPAPTLKERATHRGSGERFDNLDEKFLERVRDGYLWEAKQRGFPVISADDTPENVSEQIWKLVAESLAKRDPHKPVDDRQPESLKAIIQSKVAPDIPKPTDTRLPAPQPEASRKTPIVKDPPAQDVDDRPLVARDKSDRFYVTEAGREYLDGAVTDPTGNVYAFTDKLSPVTIAAAMARLSRRGDDMRITILDEFAGQAGKDEKLLQRVITAYGDDSVQQLAGMHVVVENASNLLTKKLEWGRLGAYLEQSTRYIYYDQKDANGRYKYFVPRNLHKNVRKEYIMHMDRIFDLYSTMVHRLTDYVREHSSVPKAERDIAFNGATRAQACDAIRPVLPVATKSTVGIFASGQALENLIMHLQSDPFHEARITGNDILKAVRQVTPILFERADKPDRGGANVAYRATTTATVAELAKQHLSGTHGSGRIEAVNLVDAWPRNELDLVADMLYEHSNLPLIDIQKEVATWPYEKKAEVMRAYFGERLNRRHRPGRALEKAHYSWDLFCDYGIFRDLQRHRMVDDLEWQELTPRNGFDVPELVEEAGLTDEFEECFAISLKLHSLMQQEGYQLESQYATLLGHKMRWKVTYNAREAFHLHELRTSPQGHPGYRKLVLEMHHKLAEKHPIIAEAMKFVNRDEDPELTRLAAERYTQFKLKQLQ